MNRSDISRLLRGTLVRPAARVRALERGAPLSCNGWSAPPPCGEIKVDITNCLRAEYLAFQIRLLGSVDLIIGGFDRDKKLAWRTHDRVSAFSGLSVR
tara:strand:- start:315 stop:608 length:294 start_codon:yes stop_codon:yes gene_type:complete